MLIKNVQCLETFHDIINGIIWNFYQLISNNSKKVSGDKEKLRVVWWNIEKKS